MRGSSTAHILKLLRMLRNEASLSRQAIATVLSTDGVTAVLVGMRRKPYVDDALGAVALPALDGEAVRKVYDAFSR